MHKIKFMFEEFLRSLRQSLFKDILLMVMFSFCIVMCVIMASYYFDVGERYSYVTADIDDSSWYSVRVDDLDEKNFVDCLESVSASQNLMDYYEDIRNNNEKMISINTNQQIYFKAEDINNFFGTKQYSDFVDTIQPEPIKVYWNETACEVQAVKAMQIDSRGFKTMGMKVEEGEAFNEQNLTLADTEAPVPVILGNGYKGIIPIGQEFELNHITYVFKCKVIGILEKGTSVPEYGDYKAGMKVLDSFVVFPYGMKVISDVDDENVKDIAKYAFSDYVALNNTLINIPKSNDIKNKTDDLRNIGKKYSLPSLRIMGASMGIDLLRKESAGTIRIMLIFTVILMIFTFYSFFVTFLDKIQSNSRVYGIYLMNGCSISMIIIPCIMELFIIFSPAVFICRKIVALDSIGLGTDRDAIMIAAFLVSGICYLIGAAFIVISIKGVDTEKLIRQKD